MVTALLCSQPEHGFDRTMVSAEPWSQPDHGSGRNMVSAGPGTQPDYGLRREKVSAVPWFHTDPVSYTQLRAHETVLDLVRLLLHEQKKQTLNYTADLYLTHRSTS